MGEPLLLLQAASRYRGDLEDRRTEILVVGLNDHRGFLEEFLRRAGVHRPWQGAKVRTQQIYRIGDAQKRVRVDVVIRLLTEDGATDTLVFIECKFNPDEDDHAHWFPPEQGPDQLTALWQETAGAERRLVAIVSDCDLENPARPVPKEYEHVLGWREIAELAGRAGGPGGWQELARDPSAHAKQRVLLEIWAYLKGDVVGALEDEDLVAIGHADQAWNRVYAVLERVSEILGWHAVDDEWTTLEGTTSVNYIGTEPPDDSWLDPADGGWLYVVITNNEWDSAAAVGEPQIYAGWGVGLDREQLDGLAKSDWPSMVRRAGLVPIFDRDGAYAFARRDLKDFVTPASTISGQARSIVEWARPAVETALRGPEPEL